MRTPRLLLLSPLLVLSACGGDTNRNQNSKDDADDRTDDGDGGSDEGVAGFGSGADDEDDGEDEDEDDGGSGSGGRPGDPAEGELFQFVLEQGCDYRWALVGTVADCIDCEIAFDLGLERSTTGSCGLGENATGTLRVANSGVYFDDAYWGAVFQMGSGYVTWNTPGYGDSDQTYYYLGHVLY